MLADEIQMEPIKTDEQVADSFTQNFGGIEVLEVQGGTGNDYEIE